MPTTTYTVTTPDIKSADYLTAHAAEIIRYLNDTATPGSALLTLANITRTSA